MFPLKYVYSELVPQTNSNYLLQIVQQRELTKIHHSHDFFEIVYVIEGSFIHIINDLEYYMQEMDFVILKPGDVHAFKQQSKNMKMLGLSVERSEFEMFEKAYGEKFHHKLHNEIHIIRCKRRFLDYEEWFGKNNVVSDDDYFSKVLLGNFINFYMEGLADQITKLPKSLAYALQEMSKPDNLQKGLPALLQLSCYSCTHLTRLMKQYLSVSPHNYIQKLRLDQAYNLLLCSSLSVEQISETVGYKSISHFSMIFKQEYGQTPSSIRKIRKKNTF